MDSCRIVSVTSAVGDDDVVVDNLSSPLMINSFANKGDFLYSKCLSLVFLEVDDDDDDDDDEYPFPFLFLPRRNEGENPVTCDTNDEDDDNIIICKPIIVAAEDRDFFLVMMDG